MSLDLTALRARYPERGVVWFDRAGSTMTEAARLAASGCSSGTIVGAEEQTSGRGRFGRTWHSEREVGLYVSIVLRLKLPDEGARILCLALGLAVAEAIARAADIACDLRWPNDVLIGEKKCAGILVEAEQAAYIAGIGININQTAFPVEIAQTATSLRIASGLAQSRERLLVHLIESVDSFTKMLETGGKAPVLRMFSQASSYVRGKHIIADEGGSQIEGITEGLNPSGFLIVRKSDGTRAVVLAGGIRAAS